MLISIPPKYAVSNVVGYIKGKSAIHIARTYFGVRPGKVAYFSGCEARPGRLASLPGRVLGSEGVIPEIKRRTARRQAVSRKVEGIEPRKIWSRGTT